MAGRRQRRRRLKDECLFDAKLLRTPIPDFRDKIEYKKKKKRRLFLVPEKTFHDVESNVVVVIVVVVVVGLRLCFVRIGEPRWISFVGNDTY